MLPHASLEDIARRALAQYGLAEAGLTFLQHSDNATFKVQGRGSDAYLLRTHVPVTAAMGAHGADADAVRSELLWLEALNRDTDLVLQEPLRNRAGELVTQIRAAGAAGAINCTLLRWVAGEPYHRALETEETARQIGALLATLHRHASLWEIPAGFTRPKRDAAYFQAMLRGIRPALVDGRISRADYAEFEQAIARLCEMLRPMQEDRQTHGIMHADAHKGNLLYHKGAIRLIDFSFCATGYYLFDLGICLSDMKADLHPAFLQGYRSVRDLQDGHPRLIEAFFIGGMVGTISFWAANPRAQALLATKVPQIAREYAAPFNRGEPFWFA
ncbi:MAG: phosphotransferase [Anaerolineae bacterium]|nr:phosphotransferase [Anaerolineae bacterium]